MAAAKIRETEAWNISVLVFLQFFFLLTIVDVFQLANKFPFTILVHSSEEFWDFTKNGGPSRKQGKNMDWTNKLAILT